MNEIRQFQEFTQERGLPIPEVHADGVIHRIYCEGDKRGTKNLWYVFFSYPVAAGAVGSWKTGESHKWCSRSKEQMTQEDREALKRQYREARQKRASDEVKKQRNAAAKAQHIINRAKPVSPDFGYIINKHIKSNSLKVYKGSIVVELRDADGVLWSVQFIKPNGAKFFLSGGRIKGVFHIFGEINPDGVIYIAEGVSTAATIFEWKGQATVAAMNAGNLLVVGLEIRQKYPRVSMVFAADNDRFNKAGNVGKLKAEEAARACNAKVLIPEFPENSTGTDWNDLFVEQGYL